MSQLKNRKHTPQSVLNLLWQIRNNDKFYFDTYGKLWLNEMIKEAKKLPVKKFFHGVKPNVSGDAINRIENLMERWHLARDNDDETLQGINDVLVDIGLLSWFNK